MTSRTLPHLLVAAATTTAVGLLAGGGWPTYVVGAGSAAALWLLIALGPFGEGDRREVTSTTYLVGAALGVGLGWLLSAFTGSDGWWPVGFLLAAILAPVATADATPFGTEAPDGR